MKCHECDKEIEKIMFFRQSQEKEKFCSNECCDKYWENSELRCYQCNIKIKEGDYYYNHNDDPNLKICVNCRQRRGGKSQAEKDKEKNDREIAKLKGEIKNLEDNPRNDIEHQNYLNFKKQKLQELEKQQKNNNPSQQRNPNKNTPNSNANNNSPSQNNNQNQSSPNPDNDPILPDEVKQWFQKNGVKLIKLEGNEWIIEYNDGSKFITPVANVSELQGAKSYLQAIGKNSLSSSELNINSSQPSNNLPPNNNLPLYIGGGVIIFLLTVAIILLVRKKDK
jgi:hypothetical protein